MRTTRSARVRAQARSLGGLMTNRLTRARDRPMARRPEDRRPYLPPNARRAAGWLAAIALVVGIAVAVRLVGGSGEGLPTPSSRAATSGDVLPITFGTQIDAATGLVATPTQTDRFGADDTFAYSVAGASPPPSVSVEVARVTDDVTEVVQVPSEQRLGPDAVALAFAVPAAALVDAFGPGEYRMRIFFSGEDQPLAEGTFTLVGPGPSAPPSG